MIWLKAVVISIIVSAVVGGGDFPPWFKFGAATAAYQVEGAWNVDGKTRSIWDTFVREHPERISDRSTGNVASDSYHLWERDVEIASELGLHFYRFSISWSRLLPTGFDDRINEKAKTYYNNLIDALIAKNIEPMIMLYHWDLPQVLQNLGGWTNPLVADWFADYSRVAFTLFGDRVKTWLTLNEPLIFCDVAYNAGLHAPGIVIPGIGNYLCNRHAMLAHAKAYRIYDKEFRPKYNGKVSIGNHIMWLEASTEKDEEAAETARQLMAGMYSHPIFSKEGGWPPIIEKLVAEKSKKEGRSRSRLPPFTEEEKELIRGTYDFYGLNLYTSRTVRAVRDWQLTGPWPYTGSSDINVRLWVRPEWESAGTIWFFVNPEGIRNQMKWLRDQYGDMEIFITENGVANYNYDLDDQDRVKFFKDHLEQIRLSITEDKINVTGFTSWTLLDNFEWADGYQSKFGMYQVNFDSPEKTRTPRASAKYYAEVIKNNAI